MRMPQLEPSNSERWVSITPAGTEIDTGPARALWCPILLGRAAAGGSFRDGGPTAGTGCPVKIFLIWRIAFAAGGDAAPKRLGLIKAICRGLPPGAATHSGPVGAWFRHWFVVVEVGRPASLLRGYPSQAHTFVGEKDRGAGEQKLTKLQDWIEAPTLKKQDAAAEQAHGGKKHVVIARQSWLEIPHEVEECAANGQNDPNNAGPIQAGVDHGSQLSFKPL